MNSTITKLIKDASIRSSLGDCVSCHKPLTIDPKTGLCNHKCSKVHVREKEKRHNHVDRMPLRPNFGSRLEDGFYAMGDD